MVIKFDFLCSFKEHYTGKAKIKYNSCDFASFTEDWKNENWEDKFEGMDFDNMWNCFSEYYHESVEKYVPKYILKKGCKPKPQWMTADSLNSIKEKRHAWSQYYATKRKCDFEKYKRVRNQTNEVVRTAKRNFERKIAGKVNKRAIVALNCSPVLSAPVI